MLLHTWMRLSLTLNNECVEYSLTVSQLLYELQLCLVHNNPFLFWPWDTRIRWISPLTEILVLMGANFRNAVKTLLKSEEICKYSAGCIWKKIKKKIIKCIRYSNNTFPCPSSIIYQYLRWISQIRSRTKNHCVQTDLLIFITVLWYGEWHYA